jgi:predicted DNA-binding transcriptional regulator YafY
MRDRLGVPIAWQPSNHSYHYTQPCDLLPLLRFDADEALALVLASRTFAAWSGSVLGRALTAALEKLAPVLGGAVSLPGEALRNFVYQPTAHPEADAEHHWFAFALEAIQRRRELEITYQKPHARSAVETRILHPLHLAFLDHRWMLIAHDTRRDAIRNFLLTRIRTAKPTGGGFTPPADFDVTDYLGGSLGRFTGGSEYVVRIAFDATAAPYVRETPWHSSQIIRELPAGAIETELRLNNLIDIQRRLLACGSHARVITPHDLREAIAAEIATMARLYKYEAETWEDSSEILPAGQSVSPRRR